MKLTSRQDIEAPIAFVFAALKDFDAWERAALRRGADVSRTDRLSGLAPGNSWLVKFAYRGKERKMDLRLVALDDPSAISFSGAGGSLKGDADIDLMPLAAQRTRLSVVLDLKPQSIAARVILQSFRLARARVDRRFGDRVSQFCAEIETRYRQTART
jgi:hypothetical protein